jgi:GH24 family phage-related lysozyme (muramidase)
MKLSEQGAAFIAAHEGFVPRWYLDPVGIPTIGYGFTWRSAAFRRWWKANRPGVEFDRGVSMTRAECEAVLRLLVDEEYGAAVNTFLGGRDVPQHVFDAMSSVAFNAGPGSLKWSWAREARAGNYAAAADRLRTTAVTAKGKRLPGLVRRRAEEAALLEHGDYAGAKAAPQKPGADNVLSRGSRGGRVLAMQQGLKALGYYDGALDGIFGHGTQAAVLEFQRGRGLAADGIAGPLTLEALERAVALLAPVPTPTPPEPANPRPEPAPAESGGFWQAIARAIRMIVKGTWK